MGRTHTDDSTDTGEHPKQAPGMRALGAMEQAARRAREATAPGRKASATHEADVTVPEGATRVVPGPPPPHPPVLPDPPVRSTPAVWREPSDPPVSYAPRSEPPPLPRPPHRAESNLALVPDMVVDDRRQRQLLMLVSAVGSLVVIGLIAIVVSALGKSGTTSPPAHLAAQPPVNATKTRTTSARTGSTSKTSKSTTHHKVVTSPNSTPPSALPSTPGAAPVILSLSPASGGAGQAITISGANFMSSSGQIVAKFDGQVAPTSCPEMSTCTVTVPTLPAGTSGNVPFTITTDSGTSNAEDFSYS